MSQLQAVIERAQSVEDDYFRLRQFRDIKTGDLDGLKSALEAEKKNHKTKLSDMEILGESTEVMKKLIGVMSEKGIHNLKQLLTYGMKTIFDDEDYGIDVEISERGDAKTAEFYLVKYLGDGTSVKEKLKDSVGGGIISVVSLILRIYFVVQLQLRRVLILDESLSHLSAQYIPGLFDFLRHVINDLGFQVLFVTHDPRFLEYGDRIYRMSGGKVKLERQGASYE